MTSMMYNALVPAIDTPFDPSVHARTDLRVTDYSFAMEEGGVLKLTVTCENLGIGIMSPGRDQYLLVSWADEGDDLRLVFRGVANSMPANLVSTLIDLDFLAQPDDFDDKLLAFARTKWARPYVDELISGSITEMTDPATVLEARSEMFHIDPVTHEITLSDIIDFDRLFDIGPNFDRPSLDAHMTMPPLRSATLNIVAEWTQEAEGEVDIAGRINSGGGENGRLTLTDVSSIGDRREIENSGWSVGDVVQANPNAGVTSRKYLDGRYQVVTHQRERGVDANGNPYYDTWVRTRYGQMPLATYTYQAIRYPLTYSYRQPRREIIKVTATADVQDVRAFGFEEDELDDISLSSLTEDATTPAWEEDTDYLTGDRVIHLNKAWRCQAPHTSTNDFQALLPEWQDYPVSLIKPYMYRWVETEKAVALKDKRYYSFVETDRGHEIAEHGLLRVRALLRHRLRALSVTFMGTWEDLHDISLRDGVHIEHYFFPGGWARGKVTGFRKVWSASDRRRRYVEVTLGVSVANGVAGTIEDGGEPYSEAFARGYAWADTEGVGYDVGDMRYTLNGERIQKPVNPYLLKNAGYACVSVQWKNLISTQLRVAAASQVGFGNAVEAVAAVPTYYQVRMRSLAAKSVLEREITVTGSTVTARKDIELDYGG